MKSFLYCLSSLSLFCLFACSQKSSQDVELACLEVSGGVDVPYAQSLLNVDIREVSNDDYRQFVDATGYQTRAERGLPEERYAFLPDEARIPGSAVFVKPEQEGPLNPARWWRFVPDASWQQPEGPGSNINGKGAYPVVHIAYEDAIAYAEWAGRRLPTEEEYFSCVRPGV